MATKGEVCPVKLGFLEEDTDVRLLQSSFFPSKVGGKPAWLSLHPIPEPEDLQCSKCNRTIRFLLQVYAPLLLREETFHRTIFLFVCPNPSCSSPNYNSGFKIFRSQLARKNDFYSQIPPPEELPSDVDMDTFAHAGHFQKLCSVCGAKGPKKCSQCKMVSYCGKEHQVIDWKSGHKKDCLKGEVETRQISSVLFKESDLVTEDELVTEETNPKTEEERMQEFENLIRSPGLKQIEGLYDSEELEKTAVTETEDDREFQKFKKRIKSEPTQVLRYCRGGEPLWVSAYHKATSEDIPNCPCGSQRIFEFQVMPQLLNHLGLDDLGASVDWGTLCVYTCSLSCHTESYAAEFLWKQDFHV